MPTIYNADTLGIRPDLVGGRDKVTTWKDLLDPKYKGKTALVDYAAVGVVDVAMLHGLAIERSRARSRPGERIEADAQIRIAFVRDAAQEVALR